MKRFVLVILLALAAASVPCTPSKPAVTIVYATANGKKFHSKSCRTIKKSKVEGIPLEEAIKKGLEPCKICKPSN